MISIVAGAHKNEWKIYRKYEERESCWQQQDGMSHDSGGYSPGIW